jgi:serine protease Do
MTCLPDIHFKRSLRSLVEVAFFSCLFIFYARQELTAEGVKLDLQSRIETIYNNHHTSVVRVKATREVLLDDNKTRRLLKMGSGFFISKDGHILTTGLLTNPDRIWIEHQNAFYLAKNIGKDSLCNLSLLKIVNKPKKFSFVTLSDTTDKKKIGSLMVALTCALEFQVGPTHGLLQSQEFSFGKKIFPTKMLRCSLGLGPGEVGAPVFDLNGRFVGICHAALPDLRSSFVLPATACQRIRDDLIFSGNVDYGWFGITTTRKLNDSNGFNVVIQGLLENSPAAKSKLKIGDIIRKIDGKEIKKQGDLANTAFFSRPDNIVEFFVFRGDKEFSIPVQVEKRPTYSSQKEKEVLIDGNASKTIDSISSSTSIQLKDPLLDPQ